MNITIQQLRMLVEKAREEAEKLEEFSVAGMVGGFTIPLGAAPENYMPSRRRRRRKNKKS
jgi:hypothetical protein